MYDCKKDLTRSEKRYLLPAFDPLLKTQRNFPALIITAASASLPSVFWFVLSVEAGSPRAIGSADPFRADRQ